MAAAAQTNLQLYRQLADQGAAPSDLAAVRRAYELATSLFAGLYRASGKPFVAHLVGTASVLAAQRVRLPLVTAGLLHAAYVQGDFGDGAPGQTRRRKERLVEAIGGEAERLVARYAVLPWKAGDLSALRDLPASLDPLDRDVFAMRLANEVEDLGDFGVLHHADAERRREEALQALPVWIGWAKAISADGIALALEGVGTQIAAFRAPDELRTGQVRSYRPGPVSPHNLESRTWLVVRKFRGALRRLGLLLGKAQPRNLG